MDGALRRPVIAVRCPLPVQVDMSVMTALHGLQSVEPPMAWMRAEYVVPATVLGTAMFRVLGKIPKSTMAPVPLAYCT